MSVDAPATDALHPSALAAEVTGRGPPLVLLHGLAMNAGVFGALIPELAQRHRVIAIDLPGHGRSGPIAPCTLDTLAATIGERIAAEHEPAVVLGWSQGGQIAMRLALAMPERIASLVLVNTTPRFAACDDWPHATSAIALSRFQDELLASYRLTLTRFLTLQVEGSEHGRAALAVLRREHFGRGEPDHATLAAMLEALATTDLRAEVAAIRAPTLVITGARDLLTPPSAGEWLARTIPGAKLATIAGAAHVPFLSHPAQFRAALDLPAP